MVRPVSAKLPGLLNVNIWGVLLAPTVTEPKFALAGNKLAGIGGAVPTPVKALLRLVVPAVIAITPL